MKRTFILTLIMLLILPQVGGAASVASDVTDVRLDIEDLRHDILTETIKVDRAYERLSSTLDEVVTSILQRSDFLTTQIEAEHEIVLKELEITELTYDFEEAKYERELDYISDYANEGDKDAKEIIEDEYNDDIDALNDTYKEDKDELNREIEDFEERISTSTFISLNYLLDQEVDRHEGKKTSITQNSDEVEGKIALMNQDLETTRTALSEYQKSYNEYVSSGGEDANDDREDVQERIIDEMDELGDEKSALKSDLQNWYDDQIDELDGQINDRQKDLENVTDEVFDSNPSSKTRDAHEDFQDYLQDQIQDLQDMKDERNDWYDTWNTEIETTFDEITDSLNDELEGQSSTIINSYSVFSGELNGLTSDVEDVLDMYEDESVEAHFSDVPKSHDFFEAVEYLYDEGITTGRTTDSFAPNENVTREEFVTFILRAKYDEATIQVFAGSYDGMFEDVPDDSTLSNYVKAGYVQGVTTGRSETEFGFGEAIRRDEAIVMVMRAYNVSTDSVDDNPFTDISALSTEFQNAIVRANELEIISGAGGLFRPADSITRGETSKIIWKADLM